jgi:hypothetical protein
MRGGVDTKEPRGYGVSVVALTGVEPVSQP